MFGSPISVHKLFLDGIEMSKKLTWKAKSNVKWRWRLLSIGARFRSAFDFIAFDGNKFNSNFFSK